MCSCAGFSNELAQGRTSNADFSTADLGLQSLEGVTAVVWYKTVMEEGAEMMKHETQ